ncbi:ArsR/SmtB family transcription factor [Actinomadura sp. 3N508]|uniref:ArsR/SmtB family transcription factor n=1 Tax=Actinomadura sp. 3N508 TaxID=3375153 RepID=UPI0037964923
MSGDPHRKTRVLEQIARVGKALGNAKRLELLDLLAHGESCVDALASSAGLGVGNTSAHLQILKSGGLVTTRREGTRVYYRLADQGVADVCALLRQMAAAHLAGMAGTAATTVAYRGQGSEETGGGDQDRRPSP